jgi:hypothetical protein
MPPKIVIKQYTFAFRISIKNISRMSVDTVDNDPAKPVSIANINAEVHRMFFMEGSVASTPTACAVADMHAAKRLTRKVPSGSQSR